MNTENNLDPRQIIRSFNKAAAHYDKKAVLQFEVGQRLIQHLDGININPNVILDLGSGTGKISAVLKKRYPKANLIEVDIAFHMLKYSKQKQFWFLRHPRVQANNYHLPFKNHSVDLIFSNLVFHWCEDLTQVFSEVKRILKPGGLLLFSTLGVDTLKELRKTWSEVDNHPHVHPFQDMHDIGDALIKSGWKNPVLDTESIFLKYADVIAAMKEIKQLGGHNMMKHRSRYLMGKSKLKKLKLVSKNFHDEDEQFLLTYEVIYAHAWSLESSRAVENEVHIPIEKIYHAYKKQVS